MGGIISILSYLPADERREDGVPHALLHQPGVSGVGVGARPGGARPRDVLPSREARTPLRARLGHVPSQSCRYDSLTI